MQNFLLCRQIFNFAAKSLLSNMQNKHGTLTTGQLVINTGMIVDLISSWMVLSASLFTRLS
jgi:hypothetical protein